MTYLKEEEWNDDDSLFVDPYPFYIVYYFWGAIDILCDHNERILETLTLLANGKVDFSKKVDKFVKHPGLDP